MIKDEDLNVILNIIRRTIERCQLKRNKNTKTEIPSPIIKVNDTEDEVYRKEEVER